MAGGAWLRDQLAYWCNTKELDDITDERNALLADVQTYIAERDAAREDARTWRSIATAHAAHAERLEAQIAELTAPHNGHRPEVRTWQEMKREMVP